MTTHRPQHAAALSLPSSSPAVSRASLMLTLLAPFVLLSTSVADPHSPFLFQRTVMRPMSLSISSFPGSLTQPPRDGRLLIDPRSFFRSQSNQQTSSEISLITRHLLWRYLCSSSSSHGRGLILALAAELSRSSNPNPVHRPCHNHR